MRTPRKSTVLAGAALALAVTCAYWRSLSGTFIFDDIPSVADNPTIRSLWPLGPALSPPHGRGFTVSGRPLLNLSFALNHALGGLRPWGYHAVNIGVHILAAWILFGVVRRAFTQIGGRLAAEASLAAFTA